MDIFNVHQDKGCSPPPSVISAPLDFSLRAKYITLEGLGKNLGENPAFVELVCSVPVAWHYAWPLKMALILFGQAQPRLTPFHLSHPGNLNLLYSLSWLCLCLTSLHLPRLLQTQIPERKEILLFKLFYGEDTIQKLLSRIE